MVTLQWETGGMKGEKSEYSVCKHILEQIYWIQFLNKVIISEIQVALPHTSYLGTLVCFKHSIFSAYVPVYFFLIIFQLHNLHLSRNNLQIPLPVHLICGMFLKCWLGYWSFRCFFLVLYFSAWINILYQCPLSAFPLHIFISLWCSIHWYVLL